VRTELKYLVWDSVLVAGGEEVVPYNPEAPEAAWRRADPSQPPEDSQRHWGLQKIGALQGPSFQVHLRMV